MKKAKDRPKPSRASRRFSLILEAAGTRTSLRVEGVERFLVCEPTRMLLSVARARLAVEGAELGYLIYGGGAVEITGRVDGIRIEREGLDEAV